MQLEKELIRRGLISEANLSIASALSRASFKPLPAVLVDSGYIDEADLLKVMANQHGLKFVLLSDMPIDSSAVRSVSAKLASHYGIVPVQIEDGVLTIAVSNPLDTSCVEDIETNLGLRVERVLACRADIRNALRTHYGVGAETVERILADSGERDHGADRAESYDLERMAEDASVVKLVNQLLQEAIKDRATDIHFEVHRERVIVRRRIDGILYDTSIPKKIELLYPAIVSRIKLMSGLNIVERRLPQDGRARVKIGNDNYDLRISIVPAVHGEDIVIRILPSTMLFDLANLGFSKTHLSAIQNFVMRPHGIIFVTGPTGSGKSTTLYACLSTLNTRDRKIITVEDPVEYELDGITQTQINPKLGLTFANALRSMLRHDPDVMMVGEVRDRETAEIAIQTAMTGHLVLSTLHTNDASSSAVRLVDMGIEPYLITPTVQVFIAQRLVRVICTHCKESYESDGKKLFRGAGCKKCGNSGYQGRIAIAEFLPMVPEIQELISARASALVIRKKADSMGMKTLAQDGEEKVAAGKTTMEELLRVTSV
ncbi:MAG: Flp pilus assembly complex ATPase component TadA [Lentisphaerae bacterium]|nr:Flp pilus assembly complex ATPase component TadA [Lentisphaerota bacterium]